MLMAMDNDPTNDRQFVAAFLIARPPHAYLGWGWESDDRDWNDLFYLQVGEPLGLCAEGPSGVFSRPYTLGTAGMNCNNYTATLPFCGVARPRPPVRRLNGTFDGNESYI